MNWKIDDLFITARLHANGRFPLLPQHAQDPQNYLADLERFKLTRSIPYGHAHVIYSSAAKPFLLLSFVFFLKRKTLIFEQNGIHSATYFWWKQF